MGRDKSVNEIERVKVPVYTKVDHWEIVTEQVIRILPALEKVCILGSWDKLANVCLIVQVL